MNHELSAEVISLVEILWEYNHMHHTLVPSDCILVLGTYTTLLAHRGVDLWEQGMGTYIIFSGGAVKSFGKPEAEAFAEIAITRGVPEDKIIIENQSSNTGENIQFTKKLLEKLGKNFESFIVVQKPYMERRSYATFKKV